MRARNIGLVGALIIVLASFAIHPIAGGIVLGAILVAMGLFGIGFKRVNPGTIGIIGGVILLLASFSIHPIVGAIALGLIIVVLAILNISSK